MFPNRLTIRIDQDIHTGCWNWMGKKDRYGYSRTCQDGKEKFGHRVIYELTIGPIPAGYDLHHKVCENKGCVNPLHMEPLPKDVHGRLSDKSNSGWNFRAKTHCPQGHPYDEENTAPSKGNPKWRSCRACDRLRQERDRMDPEKVAKRRERAILNKDNKNARQREKYWEEKRNKEVSP